MARKIINNLVYEAVFESRSTKIQRPVKTVIPSTRQISSHLLEYITGRLEELALDDGPEVALEIGTLLSVVNFC